MQMLRTMMVTGTLTGSALLWAGVAVGAQSKTIPGESVTMTATIEAIDQSSRTLTVKNDKGIYETIQAPPEVKRFSELKVGDKINARYYTNVVVRLKRPDEPAVDVGSGGVNRGEGKNPGGTIAAQRTMTVTVTAMDPKTSSLTVEGPNGYKYSRKVSDKKAFSALKVGDRLDMTWTEALLISVAPAK
jgi:hypothetical protein